MSDPKKGATSCDALRGYLSDLDNECVSYRRGVTRAYVYWISTQAVSLLAGFAGAIISLVMTKAETFPRIMVAVLSLLASLAGTVLVQLRLYELWRLREDMEPELMAIVQDGHRKEAACQSNGECDSTYKELIERHKKWKKEDRVRWFAILGKASIMKFARRGG
jgi:hypothetical protein